MDKSFLIKLKDAFKKNLKQKKILKNKFLRIKKIRQKVSYESHTFFHLFA
jgi:hypothetical protein